MASSKKRKKFDSEVGEDENSEVRKKIIRLEWTGRLTPGSDLAVKAIKKGGNLNKMCGTDTRNLNDKIKVKTTLTRGKSEKRDKCFGLGLGWAGRNFVNSGGKDTVLEPSGGGRRESYARR